MNHIYKVVWSKVRGCYVVVAEIARSNGKTRSQKVVAVLGTALISSMLFTGGGFLTAEAASQTFGTGTTASGTDSIAAGNSTKASGANSIAAGNTTTASGSESIALGTHNTASGMSSIAFGGTYLQQTVRKHGTNCPVYQIEDNTYYKYGNNYYGIADDTQFTGDTSTATAVMVAGGNTAQGAASVAFGENTKAVAKGSVAFGMNTQAGSENGGQNSIAFGNYTQALGGRSVAFGEYTIANYNDSVAFGNDTRALSTGATAFGNRTRALAQYSTAWGNATVAANEESTAWGTDTIAGAKLDENGAVTNNYKINPKDKNEPVKQEQMDVHGNLAYTYTSAADNKVYTAGIKQMPIDSGGELHDYVVLDGQDGNTYVRDYQGSLWKVNVDANGKVTVDTTAGAEGKVYNGNGTNKTSLAKTTVNGKDVDITPDSVLKKAHEGGNGYDIEGYKDATAFGYSTEASGDYATAFGNDTQATAAAATAFGTTTTASGANATAFGENSTASGEAATAFGISSTASGKNSLAALGGTASNENSIALGKDTKANNADKAVSVAIGQNAEASGAQSLAIGFGNVSETNQSGNTNYPVSATQATAKGAIAIGINTGATGEHSVAMGSYTDAAKDSSVAIGFDTHTVSDSAVAIGSGTKAAGRYSVALGLSSIAGTETNDAKNPLDGGGSVAMGYAASAEASRSIAIGTGATAADSQFTTAVGDSTIARAEGSVAIGAGSVATRGAGNKESTVSTDLNTGKTTITYGDEKKAYLKPDNLSTDKTSTWVSTTGAVSVGGQATYKEYDDNGNLVKKTKLLTRQITNVAAGSDDTDAVNVAQLKAAQPTVTSNDHSVTIDTTTDKTDYHKNYDLKIATATLSQDKTTGDNPVETGKIAVKNPTYTGSDGNPVTNENAYVTGKSVADAINNSGFNLLASKSEGDVTDNVNTLIHPGDTVTIDAGKNISLTQDKGKISIATKDNLNLGSADSKDDKQQDVPGTDGSITVNGKNGSVVAINGKDGSIGLTGPKGKDGTSTSIQMSTIMSTSTLDDSKNTKTTTGEGEQQKTTTQAPRIQYKNGDTTYEVATMDDGQKYGGDNYAAATDKAAEQNVITKKLNERLDIQGGADKTKLTEKNIGVNVKDGVMNVQLAQNIDLGGSGSVKMGDTTINNGGVTITTKDGNKTNTISLTENGLNNGGKTITNVGNGTNDSDAVNVSQLNAAKTTVKSSDNSISVTEAPNGTPNHAYDIKVATATLSNGADGKVSVTNPNNNANSYATGDSVANAINNSGFKLTASASEGTVTGKKETLIHPGDTVTIDAGKNISLTQTDGKISIATKDKLVLGKDTSDGKDGQEGTIGLTGKDGVPGTDGKQGYSTTIIKTEKGQPGADDKNGKPGVDGKDITRIVYTDKDGSNPQTVATLSDGLNFAGDDIPTTVAKKLNETLQIRGDGTYDEDKKTVADDGNIKTSVDHGAVKVSLSDKINLHQDGYLTVGGSKNGDVADGSDPIVIKHFDAGKLTVTGTDKNGNTPQSKAGDYVTGLDNKDWDVTNPTYVSGRAATEDQLKKISDEIKITAATASQHTEITVNDKNNPTTVPNVGTDTYGDYAGTGNGNLSIAAKKDTKSGKTIYNIKLNDQLAIGQKGEPGVAGKDGKDGKVTVETKGGTTVVVGHNGADGDNGKDGLFVTGKDGKDGKSGVSITVPNGGTGADGVDGKVGIAGKDGNDAVSISGKDGVGHIGLTGPKGEKGADGTPGKDGISIDITTDLKSATLDDGKNVKTVIKDKEGKETTITQAPRIQYKNGDITYEVATMDDGLKFAGDDVNTTVAKKLNDTLQIRGDGTYDATTKKSDGNIQTSVEGGTIKVALNKDINLKQDGSLTIGGDKQDGSTKSKDPIVIKHFDDKTLDVITGIDKEGKLITAKEGKAGDYVTGLDNKDWNVDKPEYVSGRAATEDQLKTISDAVKEAATTAGKHTVVTVENGKAAGTTDYNGENLKLKVTDKDGQKTYDLKLNDKVTLGKAGKDGVDGSIGLTGADGKSSIGLNGKDGISVIGKDGKNGVSITGSNGLNGKDGIDGKIAIGTPGKDGQPGKDAVSISGKDGVGHIGLTGQKGADGKDGAFTDLSTILGTATLDRNQNEVKDKDSTKDKASRIQYQTTVITEDGKTKTITHEVATMDDGLKFVGNDGKEVAKKLNSTLSLTGGMDKDAVAKASSKNLGVRSNAKGDGLELVMTDTPDFTKVTVGEGTDTTQKIIIGKQTVTGKKSDGTAGTAETGKYITGLDNTKWNKDNVVENRAATEGQLRDVAGSITNQSQGGGFGLADEAGNTVKKDLGQTVTVKGDGKNIETKVANGSLEVSLKKDVDLGGNGSINAGQTKVDQNGVDTNKVTIKDSGISISKDGINGGGKQITNIASGIDGKTYADAKDNNAASIGDVKNIAGKIEQNVTNVTNNVNQIGQHVDNIQKDVTQLQQDVKADRQYQGDDAATKKNVNVKFGRFLSLTGGAKVDALADEGNLGVIQQEKEDPDNKGEKLTGLSIRLAKDIKGLNSVEANTINAKTVNSDTFQAGNTTINNSGLTVKGDDKHKDITVQQGSVNMGGNKIEGVAPGKVAPDSMEAINGSQLAQRDQAIGKLGGEVSSLDRRVDRVGAGAAALAALHPQDFDPDDKWDFAVGYGNYRGANAAAVGAFYRPNEDTTLSVGGTVGGGENMVNAGISFKFGQGNHVTNSRVAMAKEILALKDYVQKQDEKIEKLEALVGQQGTSAAPKHRSILFPDVPENHWAYDYVKKLADRGLLEGYPDGEFKGNRTITRYEFAAIFSRALENGADVDGDMERMSEEFEPEIRELSLNRFRVDRVEGKDNDRHKIERVRVNDRDELVKQKNGEQKKRYRDVYGSVIEKAATADAAK